MITLIELHQDWQCFLCQCTGHVAQLIAVVTCHSHSYVAMAGPAQGAGTPTSPQYSLAGPPLRRTLLFLYIILNLILNDTKSAFHNVSLVDAPFSSSLAPSPRRGGIPRLPQLIDKPSAAMAATSRVAITFRDVSAPPSFLGVPTRSVASATCTPWGHQSGPKQAPKVTSTLFSVVAFENKSDCSKIRGSNGQLFNRCHKCNCDFFHPNVALQVCRH